MAGHGVFSPATPRYLYRAYISAIIGVRHNITNYAAGLVVMRNYTPDVLTDSMRCRFWMRRYGRVMLLRLTLYSSVLPPSVVFIPFKSDNSNVTDTVYIT